MKSEYLGELRTRGEHIKSGQQIITDAPTDNNGKGEAYSPTDLVCAALCSCMMTLMGIYAEKVKIDISGMTASITKTMAANPRKIAKIEIEFVKKSLQATEGQIKQLKNAALTCPVALSLSDTVEQEISFNFD